MCYRCSNNNPLMNPAGNMCSTCTQPFVHSFLTFGEYYFLTPLLPGLTQETNICQSVSVQGYTSLYSIEMTCCELNHPYKSLKLYASFFYLVLQCLRNRLPIQKCSTTPTYHNSKQGLGTNPCSKQGSS